MKTFTLCLVYFVLLTTVNSQEAFAPPGAEWVFSFSQFNNQGFEYITYDRDTIIDGQASKILSRFRRYIDISTPTDTIEENISDAYIRQEGDKIFQYYLDSFHLIFDFSWTTGIRFEVENNENESLDAGGEQLANIKLSIDSTGFTEVDNKSLRTMIGRISCELIDIGSVACITIVESIGPINRYLFYTENSCSSEAPSLFFKSYLVNDIILFSSDEECKGTPTSILNSNQGKSRFILFPNPTNSILYINAPPETLAKIEKLYLFNHLGREVINIPQSLPHSIHMNLTSLPRGMYFLKIIFADKTQFVEKIIKT